LTLQPATATVNIAKTMGNAFGKSRRRWNIDGEILGVAGMRYILAADCFGLWVANVIS
jgi:hypothetical protein